VVYDPGIQTPIGFTKVAPPGSSHLYANCDKWLYASYSEFCKHCNVHTMSRSRFEVLFMDICKHQLNLNVFSKKSTRGVRIFNVAVRDSNQKYAEYPGIVTVASNKEKYELDYGVKLSATKDARIEDCMDLDDATEGSAPDPGSVPV
jgi:hypothetical protein